MQNIVQTKVYARHAMENIQQHFMDILERKCQTIVKRMTV